MTGTEFTWFEFLISLPFFVRPVRMGTSVFTSCSFSWRDHQPIIPSHRFLSRSSLDKGFAVAKAVADTRPNSYGDEETDKLSGSLKRRSAIVSGVSLISSAILGFPSEGLSAVKQGLLAGRIPGLSEPDEQGWFHVLFFLFYL